MEITGPTDRKMTINALNSGAKVCMADFEDANPPLGNMITASSTYGRAGPAIDSTSKEAKTTG